MIKIAVEAGREVIRRLCQNLCKKEEGRCVEKKNIPEVDLNKLIRDLISNTVGKQVELEEFLSLPLRR